MNVGIGKFTTQRLLSPPLTSLPSSPMPIRPSCSKDGPKLPGDDDDKGEKMPMDWDKAWSRYKKRSVKKGLFSNFNPNKYVSWNPTKSEYPISEEIDPIKRTERSNLMFWTSPRFTLFGAIIIVSFLLIYTISAPHK